MDELFNEPVRGDWDIEPAPDINIEDYLKEEYPVLDAPDLFDRCSLLKSLDSLKKQKPKTDIIMPEDNYISIPKLEMWKALNISDLVLESKLLSGDGKLNFLEFTVVDGDRVNIKFRNKQYFITLMVFAESKGMDSEWLTFFRGDLRTYVMSCDNEDFVVQKDHEQERYKANLFDKYVYVKLGSKWDEKKRKTIFSDKETYNSNCAIDAMTMCKILRPLAEISDKKPKNEEAKETSHVHFYGNRVIVTCADKSFFTQLYPDKMVFPNCTIGASLINIFSTLVPDDCKDKIEISLSLAHRIQLKSIDFEISAPCYSHLNSSVRKGYEDIISSLENVNFARIDRYMLRRIAGYSCNMRLSTKELAFNYENDGRVKCVIIHEDESKEYNYVTYIDWESKSTYPPLEKPTIINAQSLRWLLRAFDVNDSIVGIFIQSGQVILKSGSKYAVLYSI